ncbi:MAG TPA: imelysin family protein, partial [Nannocystaceae bacterium]|nr:imelysin family protein [Nannocystaceae bacterium]
DGGDFGGELVRAGGSDTRYSSVKAALDEIVNGIIALLQLVDDTKLARPLGSKTGGTPQPELVPSPYADDSVAMIRANLESTTALWRGEGGLGLRDLVVLRSRELADAVDAAFAAADEALQAIDIPLRDAVVSKPEDVQRAIDRVKDLRRLFTVDIAQQLDVTVTLSDNDGD